MSFTQVKAATLPNIRKTLLQVATVCSISSGVMPMARTLAGLKAEPAVEARRIQAHAFGHQIDGAIRSRWPGDQTLMAEFHRQPSCAIMPK